MDKNRSSAGGLPVIFLLADGQNNCGDLNQALNRLKMQNILFKHEAIGLEVDDMAKSQLATIANISGGQFHDAQHRVQLTQVFLNALELNDLINMMGQFGRNTGSTSMPKVDSDTYMNDLFNPVEPPAVSDKSRSFDDWR